MISHFTVPDLRKIYISNPRCEFCFKLTFVATFICHTQLVCIGVATKLALILASAGRFVADVSTAMQLSWAMKFLRWTSEEGVAYFFLLGALPEL